MTTEQTVTETNAIEAMRTYVTTRISEGNQKKPKDAAGKVIRAWLADQPEGFNLYDGEWGITARLQVKSSSGELDIGNMGDQDIVEAARGGLLRFVSKDMADGLCDKSSRLAIIRTKYEMPGKPSTSLEVKS
jgi:hypothetical protein